MTSRLNPETDLERAFVQALRYDARALWRRAMRSFETKQWSTCVAQWVCLAKYYGLSRMLAEEMSATDAILEWMDKLDVAQRLSLLKVCCCAIELILEEDDELSIDTSEIQLILRVPLHIVINADQREFNFVDMLRFLTRVYGREIRLDELAALNACCERVVENLVPTKVGETSSPLIPAPPFRPATSPPRKINAFVTPAESTSTQVLEKLHAKLTETTEKYGLRSAEVGSALVSLVDYHVAELKNFAIKPFLEELRTICTDESVELDTYQLRAIYSITGQIRNQETLLPLIEDLERSMLVRKGDQIGYDINTGPALMRLVGLWQATGTLDRGEEFCSKLLNRARKVLSADDFAVRQLQSIHDRVSQLRLGRQVDASVSLRAEVYDHCEEYVLALTTLALDHLDAGRRDAAGAILQELLLFYKDCVGDPSVRVGEMLWLLTATELVDIGTFAARLIELSESRAYDRYLIERLNQQVVGLVDTMSDRTRAKSLLEHAIATRKERAMATDENLAPLMHSLHAGSRKSNEFVCSDLHWPLKASRCFVGKLKIGKDLRSKLRAKPTGTALIVVDSSSAHLASYLRATAKLDKANRSRIQSAYAFIVSGDIFDAVAKISEAFASIYEPEVEIMESV